MENQPVLDTRATIHPATRMGRVHLRVRDLDGALHFYQQSLGFQIHWHTGAQAGLGAGGEEMLRLSGDPNAPHPRRAAGLYHFAVLLPSRAELARSLYRLVQTQTPLQGAADHWVSEAIYLADPEGNGIEIYRDRPRAEWPPVDDMVRRGNGYFDLRQLLSEHTPGEDEAGRGLHPDTTLGHMHLRVADISAANTFYLGVLGFERQTEMPGQASFVSAGGYHHHIAYNVWGGRGVPPAPAGALGLADFTVVLPDAAALAQVTERIRRAGIPTEQTSEGLQVRDPAGITVGLVVG